MRHVAEAGCRRGCPSWPTQPGGRAHEPGFLRCGGSSPRVASLGWLAALVLLACGATAGTAARAEDSFGTIRLTVEKVGEEEIKPDLSPRLAVLLVDCSSSMNNPVNPGGVSTTNPPRRHAVHDGLRKCLEQLAKDSPGIEARVRFFNDVLDCRSPVAGRLDNQAAVEAVMKQIPRDFELAPGTHLYESTCRVIDEMLVERKRRGLGWMLFGVFSDGEDQKSKAPYDVTAHDARVRAFQQAGQGCSAVVWPVGPEAEKLAAGKSAYGPSTILKIGEAIPKPPPPRPRFELKPAQGQSADVSFKRLAQRGPATVTVEVGGPKDVLGKLRTRFHVDEKTPYKLQTVTGTGFDAGPVKVALDLPQNIDVASGVALGLGIDASAPVDAPFLVGGDPSIMFTFLASKTLPPERWKSAVPEFVMKGKPAKCSVNPGVLDKPTWTFTGPGSQVVEEPGRVVAPVLQAAGTWRVSFKGVADTGEPVAPKDMGSIEVIDADFTLDPAGASALAGRPATLRIVPVAGAAAARHLVTVDGERLDVSFPTITVPADRLQTIGRHVLSVTARSERGGFEWTHDSTIDVLVAPRIEILSGDYREAAKEAVANVYVSGDVGNAVLVRIDGRDPVRMPVIYDNPAKNDRSTQLRVPVPADTIGRAFDIEVAPAMEDACPPAKARIEGRPANIFCSLRSPADGATVIMSPPQPITVEPGGDDRGDVGDVRFVIGFRRGGDTGEIKEGPSATSAAKWVVYLPPELSPGPLEIHARPVGGLLRPDVFPEGKSWRRIGVLHVPPPVPWISVVGADPPSTPPREEGEAGVLGPVLPGKVTTLELRNVPAQKLSNIEWTLGGLDGDPKLSSPTVRSGGAELVTIEVTPQACGVLPVRATMRLQDGGNLPVAMASLLVEARNVVATPWLEVAGRRGKLWKFPGKNRRAAKPADSAAGSSAKPAPSVVAAGDLIFHPGIEGDFAEAIVAVFERDADAGATPHWSQTIVANTDTVRIPLTALPAVRRGQRSRPLKVCVAVSPYPGCAGGGVPRIPCVPFEVLAPKHPGFFLMGAAAILAATSWFGRFFVGHHLRAGTLVYDFARLPDPNEDQWGPDSGRIQLDGGNVGPDQRNGLPVAFMPWSLRSRQARVPLALLARLDGSSRSQWILDRDDIAGHTLIVSGDWDDPIWHPGHDDDPVREPLVSRGLKLESQVYPHLDLGVGRVSRTQKLTLEATQNPKPAVYYRVFWERYRDPVAWWRWAIFIPAIALIIGLIPFLNPF